MKMTGHRTEAVYARYAIVDAAMLQEAAVKLGQFHAAEGADRRVSHSSAIVGAISSDR
jgi:hypothetical protein